MDPMILMLGALTALTLVVSFADLISQAIGALPFKLNKLAVKKNGYGWIRQRLRRQHVLQRTYCARADFKSRSRTDLATLDRSTCLITFKL